MFDTSHSIEKQPYILTAERTKSRVLKTVLSESRAVESFLGVLAVREKRNWILRTIY